jgi:hypothetical protein
VIRRPIPRPDNDKPRQRENPAGPRTPCPVDHPGISDQPGSEPAYIPATPGEDLPKKEWGKSGSNRT